MLATGAAHVADDVAFVNPALDADVAIGRDGFGQTVINVGAQRVQRHFAFVDLFVTRDFGTGQTARAASMRQPSAPSFMTRCKVWRMARRKAIRRSICCAMLSATSLASRLGWRISSTVTRTSRLTSLIKRFCKRSMSAPRCPMTTPGLGRVQLHEHAVGGALDFDARQRRIVVAFAAAGRARGFLFRCLTMKRRIFSSSSKYSL